MFKRDWCLLSFSRSKYGQCIHVPGCRHQWAACSSSWSGSSHHQSTLLKLSAYTLTGLPGLIDTLIFWSIHDLLASYLKRSSYPIKCCHCSLQNVVSQPQTMPPMSQAAPTNGMGYMGYQPYNMQNMISALPGQDPNMPPQQPYMPGQQPMYQQVSPLFFLLLLPGASIKNFRKEFVIFNLISVILVLTKHPIFRWLPLVARSSSNRSSNHCRLLRLCPAAQRHSSSPSTESHHAAGSGSHYILSPSSDLSPHSLDWGCPLKIHTPPVLPPRCDDVAM